MVTERIWKIQLFDQVYTSCSWLMSFRLGILPAFKIKVTSPTLGYCMYQLVLICLCFQTGKCQTLAWTKNQPTNKLFKRITQFRLSLHGTWENLSHHLWNPSLLKPNLSVQPWSLKAPALARWMPQPVCTRDGVFGMSPMPPSSRSHMEKQTPNDLSTRHTAPAYHFVLGPALFDQLRHRLLDQALQGFASIISAFVELNNNSFS